MKTIRQNAWIRRETSYFYSEPIILCLEPQADEIRIPSKGSFDIVAEGPEEGFLEVTYEERRISV